MKAKTEAELEAKAESEGEGEGEGEAEFLHLDIYPISYIQYGNIPMRDSPSPHPTPCRGHPHKGRGGWVGWRGGIPYGCISILDIGYLSMQIYMHFREKVKNHTIYFFAMRFESHHRSESNTNEQTWQIDGRQQKSIFMMNIYLYRIPRKFVF